MCRGRRGCWFELGGKFFQHLKTTGCCWGTQLQASVHPRISMELIYTYFSMLKDSATPEHRVLRKTAGLSVTLLIGLIYYRHFILELTLDEPLLVTVALGFVLLGPVNIMVGLMNAAFYRDFLRDTEAKRSEQTFTVFFAEWLFAAAVPIACLLVGPFLT